MILGCGNLSVSKLRKETLHIGEEMLAGLRTFANILRQNYALLKVRKGFRGHSS